MASKIYTVFWRDGKHLTVKGISPEVALMHEGYAPREAMKIAFFVEGDGREYAFDAKLKQWMHGSEPVTKPTMWEAVKQQEKKPQATKKPQPR